MLPSATNTTTPSVESDYPAAWEDYCERRTLLLGFFIGFLPLSCLIGIPLGMLFHSDIPITVVAVTMMVGFAASSVRFNQWRCPRCNKPFHRRLFVHNPLATRCMHCRLRKRA
jgi:hypothetical protein